MSNLTALDDLPLGTNYQIPNHLLNANLGELNVTRYEDHLGVVATILMEPLNRGARTGVALDGSVSMQGAYGRTWRYSHTFDQAVIDHLLREDKGEMVESDGRSFFQANQDAFEELRRAGYVEQTANEVDPIARTMVPYLADRIDGTGGTTAIYWACGGEGDGIESLGDLRASEARETAYLGPEHWGEKTRLLPALKYFVERSAEAEWGFFVFITDGRLDDLENVKDYTLDLAARIAAGAARPVKCVLLGVGPEIDEAQMNELDELLAARGAAADIWDHKVAADLRGLQDIFAEVVDENTLVASSGRVLTTNGELAAIYPEGLPSVLRFRLPLDARGFTIEAAGNSLEQAIR